MTKLDGTWNCPSCGDDLHDMEQQVGEQADETSLDVLDDLLRYYCESCNDFYGTESLKDKVLAP